jgi:hypothetical protein
MNAISKAIYSGTFLRDLIDTTDRHTKANEIPSGQKLWDSYGGWANTYYQTGELGIPVWALLVRVRQRLCDGAANDGVMSPGAAEAWYDLAPIQEEFVMGE